MILCNVSKIYPRANCLKDYIAGHVYMDKNNNSYVFLGRGRLNYCRYEDESKRPFMYLLLTDVLPYIPKNLTTIDEIFEKMISLDKDPWSHICVCEKPKKLFYDLGKFYDYSEEEFLKVHHYEWQSKHFKEEYIEKFDIDLTSNRLYVEIKEDTASIYKLVPKVKRRRKNFLAKITIMVSLEEFDEDEAKKTLLRRYGKGTVIEDIKQKSTEEDKKEDKKEKDK